MGHHRRFVTVENARSALLRKSQIRYGNHREILSGVIALTSSGPLFGAVRRVRDRSVMAPHSSEMI